MNSVENGSSKQPDKASFNPPPLSPADRIYLVMNAVPHAVGKILGESVCAALIAHHLPLKRAGKERVAFVAMVLGYSMMFHSGTAMADLTAEAGIKNQLVKLVAGISTSAITYLKITAVPERVIKIAKHFAKTIDKDKNLALAFSASYFALRNTKLLSSLIQNS